MKIASSSKAKVFYDPMKREYKTSLKGPIRKSEAESKHAFLSQVIDILQLRACSCYTGVLHRLQAVESEFLKDRAMNRVHNSL